MSTVTDPGPGVPSDPFPQYDTEEEVEAHVGAGGGSVAAHEAASDPHSQYDTAAEVATRVTTHESTAGTHTAAHVSFTPVGTLSSTDVQAAIAEASSEAIASGIPGTIVDAKGDLLTATAADTPARLGIGTNYYSLVADSAQSTGMRWKRSPVYDVEDYGADPTGSADCVTAINAANTAAGTSGTLFLRAGATFKITSGLDAWKCDVRGTGATINFTPAVSSAGTAVTLGDGTSTLTDHKVFHLPDIVKTSIYWTDSLTGTDIGLKMWAVVNSEIHIGRIRAFSIGVYALGGTSLSPSSPFAWNTTFIRKLDHNKINLKIDDGGTSYCNECIWVGGNYSHDSGYSNVTGSRHILITNTGVVTLPNMHRFYGASLEGDIVSYNVECTGSANLWDNCRWESTTPKVFYNGTTAVQNVVHYGYNAHAIVYSGTGTKNHAYTYNDISGQFSGGTDGVLRLSNTSSSSDPSIVVTTPAKNPLVDNMATNWQVHLAADWLKMKDINDSDWAIRLHAGGRLEYGDRAGNVIAADRAGTSSPEGAITAHIGSIYRQTDGGAGTTLWVKESGTGNTGWIAYGPSAAATPTSLIVPGATSPAQTAEGSAVWDTDDDKLTVGTGSTRKTLMNTDTSLGASQLPALTGEVTSSAGSAATTVAASHSGSTHAATQAAAEATAANASNLSSGTVAAGRLPALTGDVTSSAGSAATTLAAGSASNLNSGTLPAGRLPALTGNVTSSAGSAATTLAAGSASVLDSGTLLAARMPALTGDATTSAGAVATTVAGASTTFGFSGSATADTTTGDITDLAVTNSVYRWSGASAGNLTGITGTAAGRVILIENASTTQTLTIAHQSTTEATASRRFSLPSAGDLICGPLTSVLVAYDSTSGRWRVFERTSYSSTPAAVGTAAAGTAGIADARGDHVHATGAGTPSTQLLGDAAATGSGPAAAMTDHKHAIADLAGDVTTSGSMATTIAANAVTLAKMATIATGTYLANNTASTAVPTAVAMPYVVDANVNGYLGWSFDLMAVTGVLTPNAATIYLAKIPIPKSISITNICLTFSTGGTNYTNSQVGLYSSSGTLLSQSANLSSAGTNTFGGTAATVVVPLAAAQAVTGSPTAYVYAALHMGTNSSTAAIFRAGVTAAAMHNGNLAAGAYRWCSMTGHATNNLQTIGNLSLGSAASINTPIWMGVS